MLAHYGLVIEHIKGLISQYN